MFLWLESISIRIVVIRHIILGSISVVFNITIVITSLIIIVHVTSYLIISDTIVILLDV